MSHSDSTLSVYQLLSMKLPHCKENVCLAYGQEWSVYAVGSQAHVSFLDPRQPAHHIKSVSSRERGSGEPLSLFKSNRAKVEGFFKLRKSERIDLK